MIELKNMEKSYFRKTRNEIPVLKGLELKVEKGEMIAIMGRSGEGKSTLLHVIAGILPFDAGTMVVGGETVEAKDSLSEAKMIQIRSRYMGIVKQNFSLIEEYTVNDNVGMPLDFMPMGRLKELGKRKELVESAIEKCKIAELKGREVKKLSGGQKQRAAIARAIVGNPGILLADEPTGALDKRTEGEIMELFHQIHKDGTTIILVTHNPLLAKECEKTYIIEDGRLSCS